MIYLDHARTSLPKAPEVLSAMTDWIDRLGLRRGDEDLMALLGAAEEVRAARAAVAALIGARDPARVAFTASSTEALNLALKGYLADGDHVVTTAFDHAACGRPLARLARERGVEVTRVQPDETGRIRPDAVAAALRRGTRLLCITHASNVTGALCDLSVFGELAGKAGTTLLVDAAATAGMRRVDVEACGIGFLAFGAHKRLLGPPGIGVLYAAPGLEIGPLKDGSVSGRDADLEMPEVFPEGCEAGTPNVPGILALRAAAERVMRMGWPRIEKAADDLVDVTAAALAEAGLEPLGGAGPRVPIFSVETARDPIVVRTEAEHAGVIVAAGLFNAPLTHAALGTWPKGCIRISPGEGSGADDIEAGVREVASLI